ncbi:hypothetical protein Tco_0885130 [Tanacetum coccineum]
MEPLDGGGYDYGYGGQMQEKNCKIGEVDINTLTIKKCLALTRGNQAPSVVKPEIEGNVNFEIKSQLMRELREDTFSGNKRDNAPEHVERILDIVIRCATYGGAHLNKECLLHGDIRSIEEVKYGEFGQSFQNNSENSTRYRVGPPGYYTRMDDRPLSSERKPSLIEMITKYIEESAKKEAEHDEWLRKFQENTKLNPKRRATGTKIGECKAIFTKDGLPLYTPFYYSPEEVEYFSANSSFSDEETHEEIEEVEEIGEAVAHREPAPREVTRSELPIVSNYVAPCEPSILFPRRLEQHAEEALVHMTIESLKRIKVNRLLLKEIRQTYNYAKYIKNLVVNKPRTSENEDVKMNPRCPTIL